MLKRAFLRLAEDRRGMISPIFALAVIPVLGLIGAAVDYSRANSVRTAMQAALDSTSLAMASKAASLSGSQLQAQADAYFKALFTRTDAIGTTVTATYSSEGGSQVTVSGMTTVKNLFMGIMGIGTTQVAASSTSKWGMNRLRVALALDNTGSMASNNKMTALKTAAKSLIDQLKTASKSDGDVYISIIPFAKDVNVGAANYTATWLKWTDWDSKNGSWSGGGWGGWGGGGGTWTPANHNTWTGCVMDRDQDYDVKSSAPVTGVAATLFPTEQYSDCPVALMPLSYNWTALKNKIDSMTPDGNTNTTIGLAWAWHSLTQGAPLNAPAEDAKYTYTKVIIFLTDGQNTQNRWTSSTSAIDARMAAACTNAKNAGITIYTILVLEGNGTLLKNCASGADKYFKLTSANQLISVFSEIGTKLSQLRVAK